MNMFFIGMLLVFMGFLVMFMSAFESKTVNIETGGAVMIGPFPVVFGSSNWMLLLSSIILFITIVIVLLLRFFS
ncbi:hypothetical protein DRN74_04450 [Candidatus Micrarchaeota archaeon]|nr:MAG: hypothetical protein DRN74_04450 [Candidatus Micrarchaeota archaeon]